MEAMFIVCGDKFGGPQRWAICTNPEMASQSTLRWLRLKEDDNPRPSVASALGFTYRHSEARPQRPADSQDSRMQFLAHSSHPKNVGRQPLQHSLLGGAFRSTSHKTRTRPAIVHALPPGKAQMQPRSSRLRPMHQAWPPGDMSLRASSAEEQAGT
jgi:hypothetical protein